MTYSEAKEFLYWDGSWLDVYVLNLAQGDADRFLNFVRPITNEDGFLGDCEPTALPKSYAEIIRMTSESTCHLSVPVGSAELNCHFFLDSEIELDLDPRDFDDEEN